MKPHRRTRDEAYSKLHAFGSSGPQLPRNHHLTPFRSAFHDETQHTVASSPYSQSIEQFVAERFALSDSGETTVLDFGGVEGDGVFGELEAFLDERGQFADAAPLLAEDFLGMCCADDYELIRNERTKVGGKSKGRTDISHSRRDAKIYTILTFLCQLALKELVQFGVEDAVCHELPTFGNGGSWYGSHDGGCCRNLGLDLGRCDVYRELLVGLRLWNILA